MWGCRKCTYVNFDGMHCRVCGNAREADIHNCVITIDDDGDGDATELPRVRSRNWREEIPNESDENFPRSFQDVLRLMNDLMNHESNIDYWFELYDHERHSNRKGKKTRDRLRQLKDEGCFPWHQSRWCPETKRALQDFMEHLIDIANAFASRPAV